MTKVFKIGGNVVDDEQALLDFCREFAAVEGPKVMVHGGGVMASRLQKALGQEPVKIEGRRVTDASALEVVTMVYAGWCSKHICALLQAQGCNSIGLSGCDAGVIRACKRAPRTLSDGVTVVDYGFVGDVTPSSVNVPFLESLLSQGIVPVLNAINHDGEGNLLNTNADTIASSVAAALRAELQCCFELDGVLLDRNDPSTLIASLDQARFKELVAGGAVADGMIPKIENCLSALRQGASGACIRNAKGICLKAGTEILL